MKSYVCPRKKKVYTCMVTAGAPEALSVATFRKSAPPICVCVCVCMRARPCLCKYTELRQSDYERKREIARERETERESVRERERAMDRDGDVDI
jgi:hypothetical protein